MTSDKLMLNVKTLTLTQHIGSQTVIIHPTIIYNESDLVLCDAGYPNQEEQIERELNKHGFSIRDITKIVITHHDHDHIDALAIENNLLTIANPQFTLDLKKCVNSIKKISDLAPHKVICYHGGEIENETTIASYVRKELP